MAFSKLITPLPNAGQAQSISQAAKDAALARLGVSSKGLEIVKGANAAAVLSALGAGATGSAILAAASADAALTTLGATAVGKSLLSAATAAAARAAISAIDASVVRTRLAANTTLNVPADFASIPAAMDYLAQHIDGCGFDAYIQLAGGTYTMPSLYTVPTFVGIRNVYIVGNQGSPDSVIINPASDAVSILQFQVPTVSLVCLRGLRFNCSNTSNAFGVYQTNNVVFDYCNWSSIGGATCIVCTSDSTVNFTHTHGVSLLGSGNQFLLCGDNSFAGAEATFNIGVGSSFDSFFNVYRGAVISCEGATFNNGASGTGAGYVVQTGGGLTLRASTGALPGGAAPGAGANFKDASGWVQKVDGSFV